MMSASSCATLSIKNNNDNASLSMRCGSGGRNCNNCPSPLAPTRRSSEQKRRQCRETYRSHSLGRRMVIVALFLSCAVLEMGIQRRYCNGNLSSSSSSFSFCVLSFSKSNYHHRSTMLIQRPYSRLTPRRPRCCSRSTLSFFSAT